MVDETNAPGEIQDVDSFQGGYGGNQEGLTFSMIVHMHINRIVKKASNELRGGYYDITTKEVAGVAYTSKKYVPDTREEYCNAVDALADITFVYFDETMTKAEEDLDKEIEDKTKECMVKDHRDKEELDEEKYKKMKIKTKRKLFRELCSFIKRKDYFGSESAMF